MECWWLAVASVSQSQCVASSCLDTCSEADLQVTVACTYVHCDLATDQDLDSCAHCLCMSPLLFSGRLPQGHCSVIQFYSLDASCFPRW